LVLECDLDLRDSLDDLLVLETDLFLDLMLDIDLDLRLSLDCDLFLSLDLLFFLSDDRLLDLLPFERDLYLSLDLDFFLSLDLDLLFSLDLDRLLLLDLDLDFLEFPPGDLSLKFPDTLFLSVECDLLSLALDSPERDLLLFSLYFAALTSAEVSRLAELVSFFSSEESASAAFFPFLAWESLELVELSRLRFSSLRLDLDFLCF